MCVICVSRLGVRQPTEEQLRNMFKNNPDGAGYMYARDGKVHIHKGFMTEEDWIRAIKLEDFGKKDPVVYHCRISTQAGVNPRMTHPFPLTEKRELCEALDVICQTGIAHNGIIRMTSSLKETRFSDTAIFITDYMTRLIRYNTDITDVAIMEMIGELTNSKWAILDATTGYIATVGKFTNENHLLFSNTTYKPYIPVKSFKKGYTYQGGYYDDYPWYDEHYVTTDYGTSYGLSKELHGTKRG